MIVQFIQDIKTAATVLKAARTMREDGAAGIALTPATKIPMVPTGYWGWTAESSATHDLPKTTRQLFKDVFDSFPEDAQKILTFLPKSTGEWIQRAKMWQSALKPVMTRQQYHESIVCILDWCLRSCQRRNGKAIPRRSTPGVMPF